MSADLEAGASVDLSVSIAAGVGRAVADAIAADRKRPRPRWPNDVVLFDTNFVLLGTGAPQLGLSIGPMLGWAWKVERIAIVNATAGTYQVFRDQGLQPQDLIVPPAGEATFAPNGTYEPRALYLRYGRKLNAVGSGVTSAGILVVDYWNIREDWLADFAG